MAGYLVNRGESEMDASAQRDHAVEDTVRAFFADRHQVAVVP
jgi:hypothetical protein